MHGRGAFTCVQGGSTYSGVQPSCTSGIQGGSTYSGNFEQDRPTNGELVEADGTRFKVTYAHDCSFVWKNPKPKTKVCVVCGAAAEELPAVRTCGE